MAYTHVAQYAEYNADCMGLWCVAYFGSNRNSPVYMVGGHDIVGARFYFRAFANGEVTMYRDVDVYGMPGSWTVHYADDRIWITDGGHSVNQMERATEKRKALIIRWEESERGSDSGMINLGGYDETDG